VLVEVQDDGSGIAPDMLPHVFDLFAQGHHDVQRAQGGLGIGLWLVKRLVQLHHGTIAADSQGLGQGSTFTVRLPLEG
jgi:signal transduction histidine kinase